MLRELAKHVDPKDTVSFLARLLAEYRAVAKELDELEEALDEEDLI